VAVLQVQLLAVNASLKTLPDRGHPKPFQVQDASGQIYELLGNDISLAGMDVDKLLDEIPKRKTPMVMPNT